MDKKGQSGKVDVHEIFVKRGGNKRIDQFDAANGLHIPSQVAKPARIAKYPA